MNSKSKIVVQKLMAILLVLSATTPAQAVPDAEVWKLIASTPITGEGAWVIAQNSGYDDAYFSSSQLPDPDIVKGMNPAVEYGITLSRYLANLFATSPAGVRLSADRAQLERDFYRQYNPPPVKINPSSVEPLHVRDAIEKSLEAEKISYYVVQDVSDLGKPSVVRNYLNVSTEFLSTDGSYPVANPLLDTAHNRKALDWEVENIIRSMKGVNDKGQDMYTGRLEDISRLMNSLTNGQTPEERVQDLRHYNEFMVAMATALKVNIKADRTGKKGFKIIVLATPEDRDLFVQRLEGLRPVIRMALVKASMGQNMNPSEVAMFKIFETGYKSFFLRSDLSGFHTNVKPHYSFLSGINDRIQSLIASRLHYEKNIDLIARLVKMDSNTLDMILLGRNALSPKAELNTIGQEWHVAQMLKGTQLDKLERILIRAFASKEERAMFETLVHATAIYKSDKMKEFEWVQLQREKNRALALLAVKNYRFAQVVQFAKSYPSLIGNYFPAKTCRAAAAH